MPFDNRTPESLLGRSDSKNPASTCRGLTTAGKPCRRALASQTASNKRALQPGVVAVTASNDGGSVDAAYYCWQHKDQAETNIIRAQTSGRAQLLTVNERTSIDSLAERLGVVQLVADGWNGKRDRQGRGRLPRTASDPSHQQVPSHAPSRTVAQQPMRYERPAELQHELRPKRQPPRNPGFFALLCCLGGFRDDDDQYEIRRHRPGPGPQMAQTAYPSRPPESQFYRSRPLIQDSHAHRVMPPQPVYHSSGPSERKPVAQQRRPLATLPSNTINRPLQQSRTQQMLSHIGSATSPETTAILLSELSKPISPHDEAGYIYIFWLTDTDKVPDRSTASSLIGQSQSQQRHLDDVVSTFGNDRNRRRGNKPRTIMLKIGRANNVHRRMTEWTQQCGYALSLVRFYPYISSSPSSSPQRRRPDSNHTLHPSPARPIPGSRTSSDQVRKVPHVHRVERLIHLELAARRVKKDCAACGKEHREWFEIEATEEGIRGVDEVVRRWVSWAEGYEGS